MTKIVTVEEMRAIESAADAGGLTYAQMMENAGRAVAEAIVKRVGPVDGKRIAILVGGGNNGGDGLVAGHYLAEAGALVSAYLASPRPEDDVNLVRLRCHGMLIANAADDQRHRVLRNLMSSADIVLDALLGTGFNLPLRGSIQDVLAAAGKALAERSASPLVVAVDCPSGLDCDSGQIAPETLRAQLTVTLAAAKIGLLRFPGATAVGDLVVADIGIPDTQPQLAAVSLELPQAQTLRCWLPPRPKDAHKGTFGRAILVAGSVNFPGAAALAGEAAYRVGAGLVTLAVPANIQSLIVPRLPEATWILLPHELGVIAEEAVPVLQEELGQAEALLLGPGLGQDPTTSGFLARLLGAGEGPRGRIGFVPAEGRAAEKHPLPPCVVDADGLKLLARIPEWHQRLPKPSILTPHPGEMAVLTGQAKDAIQADRAATARRWARTWGHVVVLKGAFTIVAEPSGKAVVLPFATPALARAGTGDVLAGAIVGLLAQGVGPFEAAVLGAYLHGRAGLLAAEELGTTASVLAGDVGEMLSVALAELEGPGE
ncbi:MAG: NAD(P)H-hydrate dehydratase [Chloroflexota bacterium]